MIFSRDILFLHVPKTGGMSVTSYLLDVLPPPVHYVRAGDGREDFARRNGVVQVTGPRHGSLAEAAELVQQHGLTLQDFKIMLAVLRNPYSWEVSLYHYLRAGHPWDYGPNQNLALTRDFATFVAESSFGAGDASSPLQSHRPLESYFYLDGELPPNLTVARLETLQADIKGALGAAGITPGDTKFPWRNKSRHAEFASYYTPEAEEAVYRKYKWVFDAGFYERMPELGLDRPSRKRSGPAYTLPIVGPVHQDGLAAGFCPDCWVDGPLKSTLVADEHISGVTLEGWLPGLPGTREVTLALSVNGQTEKASFPTGESFTWEVPCVLQRQIPTELTLDASDRRRARDGEASKDHRDRVLRFRRIVFLSTTRLMKNDWDERARENAMHYVAPARLEWDEKEFFESGRADVEEQVTSELEAICNGTDPKELRALELGCGVGRMTRYLTDIFGFVRAVDVSSEMIALARANLADRTNLLFYETRGAELAHLPDDRFDFCLSYRTFQRIPVRDAVVDYFNEVHRTLKSGRLFKFQVQGVAPAAPDTWNGVGFSEQELRELAAAIGFDVVRMEGQGTEFFWNWWRKK
jgi:SAM-dependent methyltransferase